MMLEPTNQTDPEDCKLRAVSSIEVNIYTWTTSKFKINKKRQSVS